VLALAAKLHVLRRYFKQLRLSWRKFIKAAGAAVVASISLEVAVPAIVATILEKLAHGGSFTDYAGSLITLVVVFVLGCGLLPVRFATRRLLQDEGHTRLMQEIRDTIRIAPSVGKAMGPSERKEFIDTWERFTLVLTDQFIPFAIGVLGLVGILAFKAPWIIVPVLMVLVGTIYTAHKIGKTTGSKWEDYRDKSHTEHEAMDDFAASADMGWLADALEKPLQRASEERSTAMYTYVAAMRYYQVTMNALSNSFKLATVVGAVVLGTHFDAGFNVTSFLVIYGLGLGSQMSTAFNMSDMLTAYVVDAEPAVKVLDAAEPLGPPLRTPLVIIESRDVVVEYRDKKKEEKARDEGRPIPLPTLIELPDLEFGPGVTLLTGPNGRGKSTFLRALGGLVPFTGTITIGGVKVKGHDPRPSIVHVEQEVDALKRTQASDLFGNGTPESRDWALRCAGFEELPTLDRVLSNKSYSGGQRNCLVMAGAFHGVLRRDQSMAGALSLDEPTNHLDKKVVPRLCTGIRTIADQDQRLAVVIVTHDPRMFDIADRIIDWNKV
jgi:ABC-type multidrug transport system fused ATPase/permease subunit